MIKLKHHPIKSAGFQQGVTLVELMLGLAILAILATVVVPGYRDLMRSSELSLETNRFLAALTLARSQAISRGERVTLCRATVDDDKATVGDPASCASDGGYQQGWIVFEDRKTPMGEFNPDANDLFCEKSDAEGDCLLRVFEEMPDGMTVTVSSDDVESFASFQSSGLVADGLAGIGTFEICKSGYGREVALSVAGRARVIKPDTPKPDYCE